MNNTGASGKLESTGVVISLIYVLVVAGIVASNWNEFEKLSPNAWGDFLAGSFGPLALGWVVLGFFLQGRELSNSVNALHLQSQELKQAAIQQEKLAKAALTQVEQEKLHFERETKRLEKNEAGHIIVYPRVEQTLSGGSAIERIIIFDMVNVGGSIAHVRINIHDGKSLERHQMLHFWERGQHEQTHLTLRLPNSFSGDTGGRERYKGVLEFRYMDRVNGYVVIQYRIDERLDGGAKGSFEELPENEYISLPNS